MESVYRKLTKLVFIFADQVVTDFELLSLSRVKPTESPNFGILRAFAHG